MVVAGDRDLSGAILTTTISPSSPLLLSPTREPPSSPMPLTSCRWRWRMSLDVGLTFDAGTKCQHKEVIELDARCRILDVGFNVSNEVEGGVNKYFHSFFSL